MFKGALVGAWKRSVAAQYEGPWIGQPRTQIQVSQGRLGNYLSTARARRQAVDELGAHFQDPGREASVA